MRNVKFEYKENELGGIDYPDDISLFRDTYVENGFVYGEYHGEDQTIEDRPPPYIELTVSVDKSQYKVGELITFTGEFNDKSLSIPIIPISVLNRDGQHVDNIGVQVNKGVISGSAKFDKTGDFYINNKGINFHKNVIPIELKLLREIMFRVYR